MLGIASVEMIRVRIQAGISRFYEGWKMSEEKRKENKSKRAQVIRAQGRSEKGETV